MNVPVQLMMTIVRIDVASQARKKNHYLHHERPEHTTTLITKGLAYVTSAVPS